MAIAPGIIRSTQIRGLLPSKLLFNPVVRRVRERAVGWLLGMFAVKLVRMSHSRKRLPSVSAIFKVALDLFKETLF